MTIADERPADREHASRNEDVDDAQAADRRPIVPSESARVSATPWYSGVSQAIGWRIAGRLSIGKNVPEKQEQRRDPEPEDRR